MSDLQQQLRDVILLEADWLRARALKLNLLAKQNPNAAGFLNDVATECRDRARILEVALRASEPETEAKAS